MRRQRRIPGGPRYDAARRRERGREYAPPELIAVEAEPEDTGEEDTAEAPPRALCLVSPGGERASESGA
ncbi:hypothetical protein [Archangium violaceum]|uniref:Uncharacterized protein n=1 Tax=Archangium violaceum Cb vi76 TaxID=1406225 RepID=A0A084SL17_9BACT|nr:hypothetical protein [Archangium violaceum]KFA89152.1 hypothetical protein Q664_36615 [Archangium violaceum Cb vi76]